MCGEKERRGGLRAGVEVRRALGEAEEVERVSRARLWTTALMEGLDGAREGVGSGQWPLLPSYGTQCTAPSANRSGSEVTAVCGVPEVKRMQPSRGWPWGLSCLAGARGRLCRRRCRGPGPAAGVVVREDGRWLLPVHRSDGRSRISLRREDPRPASMQARSRLRVGGIGAGRLVCSSFTRTPR
jgi:hypothetical protein